VLTDIKIPELEKKRQAVYSLTGYLYQIYQTLNAWLSLAEDDLLLIEVMEDFAIATSQALTGVQVKRNTTRKKVNLNSKSVINAINAHWRFREENAVKDVQLIFLTTGEFGREKVASFPGGVGGLDFWKIAGRKHVGIEPLIEVLLGLPLDDNLKKYLKSSPHELIRNQLLKKMRWISGAPDFEDLEKLIDQKIVSQVDSEELFDDDIERIRVNLIYKILNVIIREDNRLLTRVVLTKIIEQSMTIGINITDLRRSLRVFGQLGTSQSATKIDQTKPVVELSKIPERFKYVGRTHSRTMLEKRLAETGALWLHGSSGTGKTVLSYLIAKNWKETWFTIQLRGLSDVELVNTMRHTINLLSTKDVAGLIVDDLPSSPSRDSLMWFSILLYELYNKDTVVIVTSADEPGFSTYKQHQRFNPFKFKVPYFNEDEVGELIKFNEGDQKKWAKIVHISSGAGHPQLVCARIAGLKNRGWPFNELSDINSIFLDSNKEIELERKEVRKRLLAELNKEARSALYNISLIGNSFDRDLALSIIPNQSPGELFDVLLGPWIEVVRSDRFRISPLVSDTGQKVLTSDEQNTNSLSIVKNLLKRKPFPADFLNLLMFHVLKTMDRQGFQFIAMVVSNCKESEEQIIGEQLFLLPHLTAFGNKPFFPNNMGLSVLVRIAQFRIAKIIGLTEKLFSIYQRLICECESIDVAEIRASLIVLGLSTVLPEKLLQIKPKDWYSNIQSIKQASHELSKNERFKSTMQNKPSIMKGRSIHEFLFVVRSTYIQNIEELYEYIQVLDSLSNSERNKYLDLLNDDDLSVSTIVDSSWIADYKSGSIDGRHYSNVYKKIANYADSWRRVDLLIAATSARIIMLDEYADSSSEALQIIKELAPAIRDDVQILLRHLKILYRNDQYEEMIELARSRWSELENLDSINKVFTYRELAICAHHLKNHSDAIRYYTDAISVEHRSNEKLKSMSLGMIGEIAFELVIMGDYTKALHNFLKLLLVIEEKENASPDEVHILKAIFNNAMLWINQEILGTVKYPNEIFMSPGTFSNPDPSEKIKKLQNPELLSSWYLLAELEIGFEVDIGILNHLETRRSKRVLPLQEFTLDHCIISNHILRRDLLAFFDYLPRHTAMFLKLKSYRDSVEDVNKYVPADLFSIDTEGIELSEDEISEFVRHCFLALMLSLAVQDKKEAYFEVLQYAAALDQYSTSIADQLAYFGGEVRGFDDYNSAIPTAISMLVKEEHPAVDDLFSISCYLFTWLSHSKFSLVLKDKISHKIASCWLYNIENRRFDFQNPKITIPAITEEIKNDNEGRKKLCNIILASRNASRVSISQELVKKLQEAIQS